MLDKSTTINEDLLYISNMYSKNKQDDLPMVSKVLSKPGLDDIEGKYYIEGAVVFGKVSKRSKTSRSAQMSGYFVSRYSFDSDGNLLYNSDNKPIVVEQKLVTKEEGIHLVQFFGSRNAYLRLQGLKDIGTDTVLKNIVYLRPYPAKTEAFLLDGRVKTIYKVDEFGERTLPITLTVSEEDCSIKMWAIVNSDYQIKRKRQKETKNILDVQRENEKKLQNLKETLLKTNGALINPFKNNK